MELLCVGAAVSPENCKFRFDECITDSFAGIEILLTVESAKLGKAVAKQLLLS